MISFDLSLDFIKLFGLFRLLIGRSSKCPKRKVWISKGNKLEKFFLFDEVTLIKE